MQLLITVNEVKSLSREMSNNISEDKITQFIEESENIDVKSALGDALFIDVKTDTSKYTLLLDGGEYKDEHGDAKLFSGLKKSLAYYVYARLIKHADSNLTRFGFVNKESEYSSRSDFKAKMAAYNDAFSVADSYLKECVIFLNDKNKDYPLYRGNGGIKANRTKYKILGE